ncbi:MAG: hypothetical protein AAB855_01530 [Patescibacteria group bacterium]
MDVTYEEFDNLEDEYEVSCEYDPIVCDEERQELDIGDNDPKVIELQESLFARLRTVENALAGIQKYLTTVIDILRIDISHEYRRSSGAPLPPVPKQGENNGTSYDNAAQIEDEDDEKALLNKILNPLYERESVRQTDTFRGVFSGDAMCTADGRVFPVPNNYASKSRLVQGDILLLRISADGKYLYKQIAPVKRKRTRGILEHDSLNATYVARCPEGRFRVLPASIMYYKGLPGDIVNCVIPDQGPCQWATVEGVRKQ